MGHGLYGGVVCSGCGLGGGTDEAGGGGQVTLCVSDKS